MENRELVSREKVKWLILIRLLLTTVFFSIGHLIFEVDKTHFYVLIAFVYLISVIYSLWLAKKRAIITLVITQVFIDVILVTMIIMLTGGIESMFTVLYILTILSAAFMISGIGAIITAVFVGLVYLSSNLLCVFKIMPFLDICLVQDYALNVVFYNSYVHIVTFLLISILLAALMKRVSHMETVVRLKEHLALVGEVSSEIAHEIRNPLTAISGSVELLEERIGGQLGTEEKKLMKAVVKETDRVGKIFDQFLDYAKISKGDFVKTDICKLLDEIIYIISNNKRVTSSVEIQKEYKVAECCIVCDADKIKQVFTNIMYNAFQAMGEDGVLSIKITQSNKTIEVSFQDSGQGINPDIAKKLFTPFESQKHYGLGLGLTIANKIVEMHAGRIEFDTKVGEGTNFKVILPVI
ncbi:nitrogen regulation protein NR(II) [Candidatus Omnitrophota bacterium]